MQSVTPAKTRRELNSTHMGQSIKSGKELVEHSDQLLSRQGRREVGKSFNICKKNTRHQGRDGEGEERGGEKEEDPLRGGGRGRKEPREGGGERGTEP